MLCDARQAQGTKQSTFVGQVNEERGWCLLFSYSVGDECWVIVLSKFRWCSATQYIMSQARKYFSGSGAIAGIYVEGLIALVLALRVSQFSLSKEAASGR